MATDTIVQQKSDAPVEDVACCHLCGCAPMGGQRECGSPECRLAGPLIAGQLPPDASPEAPPVDMQPPSDELLEALLLNSPEPQHGKVLLELQEDQKNAAELLGYPSGPTNDFVHKIATGLHGQQNLWNNCYISALLAALCATKAPHAWALSHFERHKARGSCLLCKLGSDLQRIAVSPAEPFIAEVTRHRDMVDPSFVGHRHWDVGEALLKLLSACHSIDADAAETLLGDGFAEFNNCLNNNLTAPQMAEQALDITLPMFSMFGAVLTSTVWCPCGRTRRKHDLITQITLKVPNAECSRTIQGAIDQWLDWEALNSKTASGEWNDQCDVTDQGCGGNGCRFRKQDLSLLPEVLVMYFNRRMPGRTKDIRKVAYPLCLSLTQSASKYELRSIIVHAGSQAASGHYYAYVHMGEAWYKFDDTMVQITSPEEALNAQATLVLYEKI